MAVNVGQAAVDAAMADGKPPVVDTQQVQHGGMHVVAVRAEIATRARLRAHHDCGLLPSASAEACGPWSLVLFRPCAESRMPDQGHRDPVISTAAWGPCGRLLDVQTLGVADAGVNDTIEACKIQPDYAQHSPGSIDGSARHAQSQWRMECRILAPAPHLVSNASAFAMFPTRFSLDKGLRGCNSTLTLPRTLLERQALQVPVRRCSADRFSRGADLPARAVRE